MSISFIVDVEAPRDRKREPCLCAQMAPEWTDLFRGVSHDWASLRAYAQPTCVQCQGTGAEWTTPDQRPQENFANENAELVASAMGLDLDGGIGSIELAGFRRGLIRARSVRTPDELRAAVQAPRVIIRGYTASDLDRALTRLEGLSVTAQRLGATRILWQ